MNGTIAYVLSRKYVEDTAISLGAVKGKPCTIEKVEPVDGGQKITFKWTGDDGTVQRKVITVSDGVGVDDIKIENGHLIFYMSNDTTIDAGEVGGGGVASGIWIGTTTPPANKGYVLWINPNDDSVPVGRTLLGEELTATTNIGSVTAGKKYAVGTDLENIIRDILISYLKPVITIGLNPAVYLYDVEEDTLADITITANVTKKSEDIDYVKYYIDSTVVETKDTDVEAGGTLKYKYTFPTPKAETFEAKVECRDVKTKSVVSAKTKVEFVPKSYYGVIEDGTTIDETSIKSLSHELRNKVGGKHVYTAVYGRFVYAIPETVGEVSTAKDLVNGFNYTESITKTTVQINGIDYNLVYLTDAAGFDDLEITFA